MDAGSIPAYATIIEMKTLDIAFTHDDEEAEADWWFEQRRWVEKECRASADQEYILANGEARFARMGKSKDRTLVVIYRRVGDTIHILAAWEPEQ
jgi:uncharacterized DUF497 family protein